jgi:hypothetical protein
MQEKSMSQLLSGWTPVAPGDRIMLGDKVWDERLSVWMPVTLGSPALGSYDASLQAIRRA